jgi:hypothetical protein
VRFRFQPWQLAALVVILCVAAVGVAQWRRAGRPYGAAEMIATLPPDVTARVYIDVGLLRRSGLLDLLAGSKAAEEPDYRKFVEQTGFDYRTDLDAVAAAFLRGSVYMAVRGHFDWKQLSDYARSQRGQCRNSICTMPGGRTDRNISFYPLKSDVLALAVSADERGVDMIGPSQLKNPPAVPPEPVWISAPAFAFSDLSGFPTGTHAFLSPLAQARQVTFAVGQQDDRLQVRLEVACNSPEAAAALVKQLSSTTDLLKKMLDRDRLTPNPRDLSGVLVAGTFRQQNALVTGVWPIERAFVEALASGQVQ